MKSIKILRLVGLLTAPFLLLASCGSPPGVILRSNPLVDGSILRTLFHPDKLTPETQAYLKEQGILAAYRKDPSETILSLRGQLTESSPAIHRLSLIELCMDQGDRLVTRKPLQAIGHHLAAAELALHAANSSQMSEHQKLFRSSYNHSAGQVARILFDTSHAWASTRALDGPGKSYRLRCRTRGPTLVDPRQFDQLTPAAYLEFKNVEMERIRREGMGAPMVGHRDGTSERRQKNPLLPSVGMSLAVNATLDYSRGGSEVELAFHDLMITERTRLAGKSHPLAADLTAPLAILMNYKVERNIGWSGLLHPERYMERMGLYQLRPYRPDQIPVIFVHGLMSSPETWLQTLNQLWSDPVLRKRYQPLVFYYPTGYPIPYNAAALRQRLNEFQQQVDPDRRNPNMRKMILIGHSMGGILSNAQIRSSGDTFTRLMFNRPIDDVQGLSPEQKVSMKEILVYEANPDVTRAIFLAAPHRGSTIARNPVGKLGSKLVKFPRMILNNVQVTQITGMNPSGRKIVTGRHDSIHGLRPDAPGIAGILEQKVSPGVTIHSIIAHKNLKDPLGESNDGVVPYWSAHLDEASSEKIVNATHTSILQANQDTLEEVRRILYLHAGLRSKH
jgi:hypothetical protein